MNQFRHGQYRIGIENLTPYGFSLLDLFWNFYPQMTLNDLESAFWRIT